MSSAKKAACRFLFLIEQGILRKSIIPTESSFIYDNESEKQDFERYQKFINSSDFDDFKICNIKSYNGA